MGGGRGGFGWDSNSDRAKERGRGSKGDRARVRVGEGEGKGEGDLTLGARVWVSHSRLGGECEARPTVGRGWGAVLRRVAGLAKADPDPTWIR